MASRRSLGPVFDIEMRISSRRWQVYAGLTRFVTALLLGMGAIWWTYLDPRRSAGIRNQAKNGDANF